MCFSCWVHPKQHLYRATPLNSTWTGSLLCWKAASPFWKSVQCETSTLKTPNKKWNTSQLHHNISQHLTTSHNISHQNLRSVEQMTGSFVIKDHLEVLEGASARTFLKAVSTAPTCDGLRCQKTLPFVKSSLSRIQLLLFSAGVARVERKKNLVVFQSKKMIWTLELQPVDDNHHFLPQRSPPAHNPPPGVS